MSKAKYLNKKQSGVLKDLFTGQLDEEEVLEKWKVMRQTYSRWHKTAMFAAEYKRRLKQAKRKSELIIARFAPAAASKLVKLTQSKKEETARKACLDLINYSVRKAKKKSESKEQPKDEQMPDISPEKASRLLDVLYEDDKPANACE